MGEKQFGLSNVSCQSTRAAEQEHSRVRGGIIFTDYSSALFPPTYPSKPTKNQKSSLSTLLPKCFGLENFSGNGMGCLVVSLRGVYLVSDYNTQSFLWF